MKYRDELVEKLKEVVARGRPRVSAIHRSEWPQLWGVIDALVESKPDNLHPTKAFAFDSRRTEDAEDVFLPSSPASMPLLDLDARTVREVEVEFDERGHPKSFREIEGES